MKQRSFRLQPGQFLKEEIEKVAKKNNIKAGVLLSMVGSVDKAVVRMPGPTPPHQIVKTLNQPLEIVSATGTISTDGCHVHASFADAEGHVFGGHLKDGCRVQTTAEIVLGVFDDVIYARMLDQATGFEELTITPKK